MLEEPPRFVVQPDEPQVRAVPNARTDPLGNPALPHGPLDGSGAQR